MESSVTMPGRSVAIIGAGPYALSTAAFLQRAGIEIRMFGEVMGFWHAMLRDSFLRSYRKATNISDPDRELTLTAFERSTGRPPSAPVPLADFVDYGHWFRERAAIDVDARHVRRLVRDGAGFRLELDDGEQVDATHVVVAAGIKAFAWKPGRFREIHPGLVSHTSDHMEYRGFRDRRVVVVGSGQSALEAASQLISEGAAEVELMARRPVLHFLRGEQLYDGRGPLSGLLYPEWGVGPPGVNWLMGRPGVFRRLPSRVADPLAARAIRPAGAAWLRSALEGVRVTLARRVEAAEANGSRLRLRLDDGHERVVDHVVLGTGYRVDLARYPFIDAGLLAGIRLVGSFPALSPRFESSIPGLYFVGAPAAAMAGPGMRFVSHTGFAARAVTRSVLGAS